MKFFLRAFTPTKSRRLNELIGFILFVTATLLFLSLASYSPVDASFNTAASQLASHPVHNWIGLFGALLSDVLLQFSGISIFLVPICLVMLATRWFKSREEVSGKGQRRKAGGNQSVCSRSAYGSAGESLG